MSIDLQEMFDLTGKVALVTGSSRGIGKAIARALAKAGAKVAIHCRKENELLDKTVGEIRCLGCEAAPVTADLGNVAQVETLPDKVEVALGKIDILVLNASVQSYQTIEAFTPEEFSRQYAVNVKSSFMLVKDTVDHMKENKWGRIVSIGSVNQWCPSPRLAIYASTKCAQTNLINNCARQYAEFGITANNIGPGVICTDRNVEALKDKEYSAKVMSMIPAGFFGNVEDCAGLALLLCSDAGRYITGTDIPVSGGMHF